MSKSKQRGTALETALVNWLIERGIEARRLPLTGSKDQGDVWTPALSFECKNVRSMALGQWVEEAKAESVNAGRPVVVFHQRIGRGDPGESFVSMTLAQFVSLVALSGSAPSQ